ncbi:MAG: two-partner secretion domain-containing protein [Trinickia sp.]
MFQISSMTHSHRLQRESLPALTPIVIALSLALPGTVYAAGPLPSGGHFVAGTGSISGNATSLTINQTSNRGVINWTNFSIGSGNRVSILNGNGATLNRVTGSNLSLILGTLSSTGSVYLINPQGIVIDRSGVVSTGGRFVASTLGIDNTSFMNGGPLAFSAPSANGYSVANLGKISSSGGDVFLIANNSVVNQGSISAPKGTAELVAGQTVLLHDSSTDKQVFVQKASGGTVLNQGTIAAAQINLNAADGNIFALAGNNAALRATGTATRDGHVWLVADSGNATFDSAIEARNANGSGGTVDMTADSLTIGSNSNVTPFVKANQWNLATQRFALGSVSAPAFQRSLNQGTSIDLQTTGLNGVNASGDIDVASSIQWFGPASLTLNAHHSLTIDAAAKVKNTGSGNLTLRADAAGIDNGGGVVNNGTVDWSASRGIVSALYDMNGSYKPGKLLANASWTSPSYSGLLTQITGYKLVNSFADLESMSTDLAGTYALGKDVDATPPLFSVFVPVGSNTRPFTGQLDGWGHTIRSLNVSAYTNADPAYVGLFATLGASAVVRNLNVDGGVTIGADDIGSSALGHEGILAADNYGTIVRVNVSGTVFNGYYETDYTYAGGLVGVNHGRIERSSSSATIDADGTSGGLAAENDGVIDQSFASGPVSGETISLTNGTSVAKPGGLVSINNGSITRSYATGAVTNDCYGVNCGAGGLVDVNNGNISQSFASGAVTLADPGPNEQGRVGAIGQANHGTIASNVYWDKDTTGLAVGVGSGTLIPASNGLTTAQMSNPASFSGWDFSSTGAWALPAGYKHPILRWQLVPPSSH